MYHDAFNPDAAEVEDLKARYRAGKVGDVEVKTKLARAMNADARADARAAARGAWRGPSASARSSSKARGRRAAIAQATMERVRDAVKLAILSCDH